MSRIGRLFKVRWVTVVIILGYIFTLAPIVRAFSELAGTREVIMHYPYYSGGIAERALGTGGEICTARRIFRRYAMLGEQLRAMLEVSFLPNFTLALAGQVELLRLQSLHVRGGDLVLDFSKEFYNLTSEEEVIFIQALLLNIERNFVEINEIFITVDGYQLNFVRSTIFYKEGIRLAKLGTIFPNLRENSSNFAACPTY